MIPDAVRDAVIGTGIQSGLQSGRVTDRLMLVGRTFFGVALIGLGIEHFAFRTFVTGRAPALPADAAWGPAWAYLSGAAFIAIGIAVINGKRARAAAAAAGVLIFLWALMRHIPLVAADTILGSSWTPAGKALTFCGGALVLATALPAADNAHGVRRANPKPFVRIGRLSLGIFLIITGIQHYHHTEFVASLVPGWIPGNSVYWTWLAGVALVTFGIGLQIPRTAPWAALLTGLMVFSWFWVVHLPRMFIGMSDAVAVFEALAVSGISLFLAGVSPPGAKPR